MNAIQAARQRISETAQHYDPFDFISGQSDCRDGEPHKIGRSESYDAGYRCQYELEQIMGAIHG